MALPQRDLHMRIGITEVTCPTCKGKGKHLGPVPYRHCLRCGGYGTVVRLTEEEG